MKKLALILTLALVGCGSDDSGSSEEGVKAWTDENRAFIKTACVDGRMENRGDSTKFSIAYCDCTVTLIESLYSYDDYLADGKNITETLRDEGKLDHCTEIAEELDKLELTEGDHY